MTEYAHNDGSITIDPRLAAMLIAIRTKLSISAPADVSFRDLVIVEDHLGGTIPLDLVAMLAALGKPLGSLSAMTNAIAEYYETEKVIGWRQRFNFSHVAFDESIEPGMGAMCAKLGEASATIAFWSFRKGEAWPVVVTEGDTSLMSFLRLKYRNVDFSLPIDPATLAAFKCRVVTPEKPKERRVRHAKFGEGIVVQSIAPDKLEIDFGDNGVRKLLASMVEEI